MIFVQRPQGGFENSVESIDKSQRNWRNARVADLDGDGLPELAVTYHSENNSFLRVFQGIRGAPYFDFTGRRYYAYSLPFAAPDLEILDVNQDGYPDLYVVQTNETRILPDGSMAEDNYCGGKFQDERWFSGGPSRIMPPVDWIPPRDMAPDLLFLGGPPTERRGRRFRVVEMEHREPGCGYLVKKFGEQGLVLAQGGFVRPGHQLLLEW